MSGPSLETEAEALERRKVEALEKIAEALAKITSAIHEDEFSGRAYIRVLDR